LPPGSSAQISLLLADWGHGDEGARDALIPLIYKELQRGAGAPRLTLDPDIGVPQKPEVDLVALDDALNRLTSLDPQQGRVIELRFFGGLSIEETGVVMGISPATVKREWATARAWLQRELKKDASK